MDQARYYKHSGAFSVPAAIGAFALGAAAGIPLAFVYAYALVYIPVVGYVTFILSFGFGLAVGLVCGSALKKSHTRNHVVALAIGLAATVVAWYASWGAWTYAVLHRSNVNVQLADLFFRPAQLWAIVRVINARGAWSMRDLTPTGAVLWAFWALEAVIILGAGAFFAWAPTASPFCERCGEWTQTRVDVARVALAPRSEVQRLADTEQITRIVDFGKPASDAKDWYRLDVHGCPRCKEFHVLDVQQVDLKVEKKGTSESTRTVVGNLLVSSTVVQELATINRRLTVAAARSTAAPAKTGT
jgi:hypothetical protein